MKLRSRASAMELAERAAWSAAMATDALRQRRFAHASPAIIAAAQRRRIQSTVAFAKAHVPYYRELLRRRLIGAGDIADADGLARMPILERDELQRDPEYFLSDQVSPERCVRLESGGTTGAPVIVFLDRRTLFRMAAHRERMRVEVAARTGRWSYREAHVVPPDSSAATAAGAAREQTLLPARLRAQHRTFSMLRPPQETLVELERYGPDVITSYGSYLEALLTLVREGKARWPTASVAVYTSDFVSAELSRWAREQLGVVVLGAYGAIEMPDVGFECGEHEGYHLNVDLYPLRVIDAGRACPSGSAGEVVISNLVNRATVLLNYRLGDRLALAGDSCRCGRTLPLAGYPERTKAAWLHLGDGRVVHVQAFRAVLRHEQLVWRYQIVQEARRRLVVRLVGAPGLDREQARARLAAALAQELPDDCEVIVEFVGDLLSGPSEKVATVIALPPPT